MNPLTGRQAEQEILQKALNSGEAELIALYGRRRIGKTFLVREFFSETFFFEVTGLKDGSLQEQLTVFWQAFHKIFPQEIPLPPFTSWKYAFERLTVELKKITNKKVTVFFDELSWMVTPKSHLLQQLDHFWNTEWSKFPHLKIILCGSAASWMMDKIIYAKGGLHNRLTRSILLKPFTLSETKTYLESRNIRLSLKQILDLYLILGGVPYYLKQIEKGLSSTQNINRICFRKEGLLFDEFHKLYSSLFQGSSNHEKIIREISKSRYGISRNQLIGKTGIPSGSGLNKYLYELEEAGFIASFIPYQKNKKDIYYRVIDEYSYFYLRWIHQAPKGIFSESDQHYWDKKTTSPAWRAWVGYAFEGVCLKHSWQIRKKLQIENISAEVGSWRYVPREKEAAQGAQIDLLFDRGDGIISICEIKYGEDLFKINKSYAEELKNKMAVFQQKIKGKKKHIFLVLITPFGVEKNDYSKALLANEVTLEDLFESR